MAFALGPARHLGSAERLCDVSDATPAIRRTVSVGDRLNLERFDALYEAHISSAISLALLLTKERELAEDIAQEAFVKVAGRFGDLRSPEAFPAYLRRTVINLANSQMRRRRVERNTLARLADFPAEVQPKGATEEGELWAALVQLPHRQRAALVLRFCEDLSEREVAEILRTTEKAVRSLVSRGTDALRKELGGTDRWIL
jgi:RNA polymerase sigma-70 factor (sigma-E family)